MEWLRPPLSIHRFATSASQKTRITAQRPRHDIVQLIRLPSEPRTKKKRRWAEEKTLKKKNGHRVAFGILRIWNSLTNFRFTFYVCPSFSPLDGARRARIECTNSFSQCIKNYLWPLIKPIGKTNSYSIFFLYLLLSCCRCAWIAATFDHNPAFINGQYILFLASPFFPERQPFEVVNIRLLSVQRLI